MKWIAAIAVTVVIAIGAEVALIWAFSAAHVVDGPVIPENQVFWADRMLVRQIRGMTLFAAWIVLCLSVVIVNGLLLRLRREREQSVGD